VFVGPSPLSPSPSSCAQQQHGGDVGSQPRFPSPCFAGSGCDRALPAGLLQFCTALRHSRPLHKWLLQQIQRLPPGCCWLGACQLLQGDRVPGHVDCWRCWGACQQGAGVGWGLSTRHLLVVTVMQLTVWDACVLSTADRQVVLRLPPAACGREKRVVCINPPGVCFSGVQLAVGCWVLGTVCCCYRQADR
jgi:hypothetical protein